MSTFVDYDSHGIVGFTDLVSNTVVLDDVSPLTRTPEILAGNLDLTYLPGIAHEAAHHACLDSPVGLALCSLWQSSVSLWWGQLGTEIPQQPSRDLAVAYVAHVVLQPLLEGLALFSEHDLVTGASPVISRVTQRVAALFSRGRMLSSLSFDHDVLRALAAEHDGELLFSVKHNAVLRQARSSAAWTERKLLLLSQPLKGPHRYLLGYLAVKGMYAALVPSCPEFIDPELFFVAAVRHFMHDKPLTDILLRFRENFDDREAAHLAIGMDIGDFLVRFQDLCDELYQNPKRVAQTAMESVIGPLASSANSVEAHHEFFMGLRMAGTMNIAWPRLTKHRREFRFSFQAVLIRLAQNGEAVIFDSGGSQEICRVPTVNGCRPSCWEQGESYIEREGSIEAVQLHDLNTVIVCVLSHDGLIAAFDCRSGQWNPEQLVELLDDMPSAIAVEGAMHAFAQWQSRTKDHDGVREAIDFYEKEARRAVDHLYPQLMLHRWESDSRDLAVQKFDTRGVLSVYDIADETRLAKLSVTVGLICSLEHAAGAMGLEVHELGQLASQLNETSKIACGFEPFVLTDRFIRSRI
jgi:hypothetical protein